MRHGLAGRRSGRSRQTGALMSRLTTRQKTRIAGVAIISGTAGAFALVRTLQAGDASAIPGEAAAAIVVGGAIVALVFCWSLFANRLARRSVAIRHAFPLNIVFVAFANSGWPRGLLKERVSLGLVAMADAKGLGLYRNLNQAPIWSAEWIGIKKVGCAVVPFGRLPGDGLVIELDAGGALSFRASNPGSDGRRIALDPQIQELADGLERLRLASAPVT
jgi:hypothetical protein